MVKNGVDNTLELIKLLPDIEEFNQHGFTVRIEESHHPEHASGAALRALRVFLEKQDPNKYWGGLRRILTPEGHYLWLCEYHTKEYMQ